MHDLVIRNGSVVDGSGAPRFMADVSIDVGLITAVGTVEDRGVEEIDAEGHVVTPGFIDGHTHMDAQVMWDPLGTCSCYHGVTTVIMGNCGFTLAPARRDQRELVTRNLERAEDIPAVAMAEGIDWTWETFPEYLDAVDRRPKAINVAASIGHSALRTSVMEERAFERAATEHELRIMEASLEEALNSGAVGFTTSRNEAHQTADGRPVASRLAAWEEVQALVGVLARCGGVFQIARESNGAVPATDKSSYSHRLTTLAKVSGVTTTFGILRRDALDELNAVIEGGGRAFGQSHSRGVSALASFKARLPFDQLPLWGEVRAMELDEQRHALSDSALRSRLVYEAEHGTYGRAFGAEQPAPDFATMLVMTSGVPPYPSVADVAAQRGVTPVEAVIHLALESDFDQVFVQPLVPITEADLLTILHHPHTVMTFSDSGAHIGQISDCSIQTHFLAYWVHDRAMFPLEYAIRLMTNAPAEAWGLRQRGLVRTGYVADLNVFDPERIRPQVPKVVRDFPGSTKRFFQAASGILATILAGVPVFRDGTHTGKLPGRLLRRTDHGII